jgi:hypothetical protein
MQSFNVVCAIAQIFENLAGLGTDFRRGNRKGTWRPA